MSDEEIQCGTFMDWSFGGQLKGYRTEKWIKLREASKILGYDPGNFSKLEKGALAPPKSKHVIIAWCNALGFEYGQCETLISAAYNFHLGKLQQEFFDD